MGMMKDYLLFLEETGRIEWNDLTEQYDSLVPNIYHETIMNEYKAQSNNA